MTVRFTLAFNTDEEELLARGKAAYGNTLGRVLKDGLRAALEGGAVTPEEHEPETSAELIEAVYALNLSDVNDREFISVVWEGDEKAAAQATRNRLGKILATNQAIYPDVQRIFAERNPRLAKLIGVNA